MDLDRSRRKHRNIIAKQNRMQTAMITATMIAIRVDPSLLSAEEELEDPNAVIGQVSVVVAAPNRTLYKPKLSSLAPNVPSDMA